MDLKYPLHISRALASAEVGCAGGDAEGCHAAVLRLADAVMYYLGAVAVAQYSQALLLGEASADPTLNRSLRTLRRVLPGQWLGWAARGLAAAPNGPVKGLAEWYTQEGGGDIAAAYEALQRVMAGSLGYTGEYGLRERVSPRLLLEMVDQYRIRRNKTQADMLPPDVDAQVTGALLPGLRAMLESASFLTEYALYAPQQRQLLMGLNPTTPMPPMTAPTDAEATLLVYPPGAVPDFTKRPDLGAERLPLFPLDPLLVYRYYPQHDGHCIAALQEVVGNVPVYLELDT
jgi:hypothetical protein